MGHYDEAPTLVLYMDDSQHRWAILHGVFMVFCGLVLIGAAPGSLFVVGGLILAAIGVFLGVMASRRAAQDHPIFEADRTGFRIRGSRLRPWSAFHGVRVTDRRSKGSKVGEVLQVRVRPTMFFSYQTVASFSYSDRGQSMANQIIVFKNRLDGFWLKEAEQFDKTAPPVVRARILKDRVPAPQYPMLRWLDGVLGRAENK